jgi:hypothetical protein
MEIAVGGYGHFGTPPRTSLKISGININLSMREICFDYFCFGRNFWWQLGEAFDFRYVFLTTYISSFYFVGKAGINFFLHLLLRFRIKRFFGINCIVFITNS